MEKEVLGIIIVIISSVILLFSLPDLSTESIFENSGSNFNNGTYQNTGNNESGIIISGQNLSGLYFSRIFDAGFSSVWNNLTWLGNLPKNESIYAVDGAGDVYASYNSGTTWIKKVDNYGRTSDTIHMFSNEFLYIISNSNKEVWRSKNGSSFTIVNNSLADSNLLVGDTDSRRNSYIVDASGDVYFSSDNGINWEKRGDFNGASTNNAKGIAINSSDSIFVVDGTGAIYFSTDNANTWKTASISYGGGTGTDDMTSLDNNLYILLNKQVYKSINNGVSWNIINNSFTPYANDGFKISSSNKSLSIADGLGRIFESLNEGISWIEKGDINGVAGNDPKGLTKFKLLSNISFQVRNCSLSNCSDGTWQNMDLNNLSLIGRYFQYQINITREDTNLNPVVSNVSIDYTVINSAPVLNILSPQNVTYNFRKNLSLNYSVSDSENNVDSCWYNLNYGNNITLSNCLNTTLNFSSNGSFIINVYSNDTQGEVSSSLVSFFLLNTVPLISIVSPQEGTTYGTNVSIKLNFSVSDNENNLAKCWYKINNGNNVTIVNCQNTSFNVSSDGNYIIQIFANDSLGEIGSDSTNFSVEIGSPTIILHFPFDLYLNITSVTFNYTPSDIDLDSCELWGDFNGTFTLNKSNISPVNNQINNFKLNLTDGIYLWNVKCNDTLGNSAFNGNKSFYIDTVNPSLSLIEPKNIKTSRTNIPLQFQVSDSSPVSCLYNIYTGGNIVIPNKSINCSILSTSFNLTLDADFVLNFYVNDSARNINYSSSGFTIDSIVPDGGGGGGSRGGSIGSGGSGGSGGSVIGTRLVTKNETKIEVSKIKEILTRSGDKKTLSINARNTGNIFLNNCRFINSGEIASWIYYDKLRGISPGEVAEFIFELTVPENIESKKYGGNIELKCDEISDSQEVNIIVSNPTNIVIKEIKQEKNILNITYVFNNSDLIVKEADVEIWITDDEGIELLRKSDSFSINYDGIEEKTVSIELSDDLVGIFTVNIALSSDLNNSIKQTVVLGKTKSIAGLAILDTPKARIIGYIIFTLIIILGIIFIIKGYGKKDKKIKVKKRKNNHNK